MQTGQVKDYNTYLLNSSAYFFDSKSQKKQITRSLKQK